LIGYVAGIARGRRAGLCLLWPRCSLRRACGAVS
jgi:hypothetical protein